MSGAGESWERAARPSVLYRVCGWIVRNAARLYLRLRAVDVHHVPRVGPVILAANHVSYLDPPLVGCLLPRSIHYLARKSLFRFPGIGWLIRTLNAVPVDRDGGGGAGLKAILDRLEGGAGIILFPEGTRSPDGNILPARAGIGLTVIKSSAPVVPVRLFGAYEAWGRHHRFPRPGRVTVVYGKPLLFEELRREAATCDKARLKAIYQEVADQLMEAIRGIRVEGEGADGSDGSDRSDRCPSGKGSV